MTRKDAVAAELKKIVRLAAKKSEALQEELPTLSAFHQVAATTRSDEQRVHFILYTLIPDYVVRLGTGANLMALCELLKWRDDKGEPQSLTTRYHKAAAHIHVQADDFGSRHEPRLLLRCAQHFIEFDIDDQTGGPQKPGASENQAIAPTDPCLGLANVYRRLDSLSLAAKMRDAEAIALLNTFIPEFTLYEAAMKEALCRGAAMEILMLHPDSPGAAMRSAALPGSKRARSYANRVGMGVRQCLDILGTIAEDIDDDARARLRIGLYDSLPSLAVYRVDDRALVSFFLQGKLAINAPQMEICGSETLLGGEVLEEMQMLWDVAWEFNDVRHWQDEIEGMRAKPSDDEGKSS